jgi:hypothetical protein
MQAERDANMQGEDTEPLRLQGRSGRRGAKWFSFDLPVDPAHPMALVVTYNHDEWQERKFDVLVDGTRVGQQTIERRGPMRFFDVEYAVPDEVLNGKQRDWRCLRPPHDPRRCGAIGRRSRTRTISIFGIIPIALSGMHLTLPVTPCLCPTRQLGNA